MKIIVAQLNVKESKIEDFLKLAKVMVKKSLSEDGCLVYKLSRGIDNDNEFLFFEKYINDKAVEHHNSSEHFKNFINSVMPLLTEQPSIEVFDAQ